MPAEIPPGSPYFSPPAPDSMPAGRGQPITGRPVGSEVQRAPRGAPQQPRLVVSPLRVKLAASGFALLFAVVGLKVTDATILSPSLPRVPVPARQVATEASVTRAEITDRNGEVLAVSVRGIALYAQPSRIENPGRVAVQLNQILPHLSREHLLERLNLDSSWVYLDRFITVEQQARVNALGHIGLGFEQAERRQYPRGRDAAHVIGAVGADGEARGGVEEWFNERLMASRAPLRLSIDIRIQRELREAVEAHRALNSALGGAAVVLDMRSGEVIGMVSNPDFSASDLTSATGTAMFNRVVTGTYEPGSTFKLFTAAMALDLGVANVNTTYDASRPIEIAGFRIRDDHPTLRHMPVPEIVAISSNIATAHMVMAVGRQRHQQFMQRMGFLERQSVELPGVARPLFPSPRRWMDLSSMTISYGHGISVTPLQVVTGVAALANGGILRNPTLLAVPEGETRDGPRVISERTSEIMRRIMRLTVTHGTGTRAEAPGFFSGGKTGTAQKLNARGQYMQGRNVVSFVGAFPMNAPIYALYVMLDEPRPRAENSGHTTAGLVAAPLFRRVVERTGPILGLTPETERAVAIQAGMAINAGGRPMRIQIGASNQTSPAAVTPPPAPRPAPPRAAVGAPGFEPSQGPIRRTDATVPGPRINFVSAPDAAR
jgi:cell division protein FtsI (penicillin-binding protein 3)